MEGTNKILALFVGLFVVLLLVGVGLSRVTKSKKPFGGALGNIFASKVTPTPTKTPLNPKKNDVVIVDKTTTSNQISQNPNSIPETGATTLPIIIGTLFLGQYLVRNIKDTNKRNSP